MVLSNFQEPYVNANISASQPSFVTGHVRNTEHLFRIVTISLSEKQQNIVVLVVVGDYAFTK